MASEISQTVLQLRRAKDGDHEALNTLCQRYQPRVRDAVAITIGKMPSQIADLDDILQEVWISAFDALDGFEYSSEGAFMSWLATIAINKVRDHCRRESREKRGGGRVRPLCDVFGTSSLDIPVAAPDPRPSQIARANEIAEAEMRALLRLEQRYRDIIVDRDILGMSYEELAQKLGYKTPHPPRALHSRAKHKLREAMRGFDA
jgi:RNA polymerase sigma-70 factor (ECF subfamily)